VLKGDGLGGPKIAAPAGEAVRAPTPPGGPPAPVFRSWHLRK